MAISIAIWLLEPGDGVLYTDNAYTTQTISHIDEDKWFEALEMGIFEAEYRRLEKLEWLNQIAVAHSSCHIERQHGG